MTDYDLWKTTPIEDSKYEYWSSYSESLTLSEMRKDLLENGVIETYTQKLEKEVWEMWVEWKVTL